MTLTAHQTAAVAHLANVAQYGDWADARVREIGLRTTTALLRHGLVEVKGQVRTETVYRSGRTHSRYDEAVRLTLAGWQLALANGATLAPVDAAIADAVRLAGVWAQPTAHRSASDAEVARWLAEADRLRTVRRYLVLA